MRIDESHNLSYIGSPPQKRRDRNDVTIPYKRRHTEAFGQKSKGAAFFQNRGHQLSKCGPGQGDFCPLFFRHK